MKYNKLAGYLREHNIKQSDLAEAINMSLPALSRKLNGHTDFTTREIALICVSCGIEKDKIPDYFFIDNVIY